MSGKTTAPRKNAIAFAQTRRSGSVAAREAIIKGKGNVKAYNSEARNANQGKRNTALSAAKISNLSHRIAGINKKTLAASGPALSKEEKAELEKELENLITIDKDIVNKLKKHTEEMKSRFDDATNKIIEDEVKKIKDKTLTYRSNTDPATLNKLFQIIYNVCKNGDMTIPSDKKVLERLKWAIPICLQFGPKMAYLVKKGNTHNEESYKRLEEFNEIINGTNSDVTPASGGAIYEDYGVSKTVGAIGSGLIVTAAIYFFPAAIVLFILLGPTLVVTMGFDILIMYIRDNYYEREAKKNIVRHTSNGLKINTKNTVKPPPAYVQNIPPVKTEVVPFQSWEKRHSNQVDAIFNKLVKVKNPYIRDQIKGKIQIILDKINKKNEEGLTDDKINTFIKEIEGRLDYLITYKNPDILNNVSHISREYRDDVEPKLNKIITTLQYMK